MISKRKRRNDRRKVGGKARSWKPKKRELKQEGKKKSSGTPLKIRVGPPQNHPPTPKPPLQ